MALLLRKFLIGDETVAPVVVHGHFQGVLPGVDQSGDIKPVRECPDSSDVLSVHLYRCESDDLSEVERNLRFLGEGRSDGEGVGIGSLAGIEPYLRIFTARPILKGFESPGERAVPSGFGEIHLPGLVHTAGFDG